MESIPLRECRAVPRAAKPPSFISMTLEEDDAALARRLLADRSRWEDDGIVAEYERRFAQWNGSAHAFTFMGGRVALSACIDVLGLQPGDEVVVPGYTCVVVRNAFAYAGVRPVFADIELDTYGLDLHSLRARVTERTRAVLLHHLYGLVCRDFTEIVAFARDRGLKVIEDCAHATGATFNSVAVGNLGDVAFYSSEHSKIFSTVQGGVATTNDPQLAEGLRRCWRDAPKPPDSFTEKLLRNVPLEFAQARGSRLQRRWAKLRYGGDRLVSTPPEEVRGIRPAGYGRRMPAPVAQLGLNQLAKIDRFNEERRGAAARWDEWCDLHGYRKPLVVANSLPVFLRYPVLVEPERKARRGWARSELGVNAGVWFQSHLHPAPDRIGDCPNASEAVTRCVNLPCLF